MTRSELLDKLIGILGLVKVLGGEDSRRQYSQDKWPRWLFCPPEKLVDAVVRPDSAKEVAKVLRFANREKIPVIPYGGGSGVCGAVRPEKGGITVDLKRLAKISRIYRNPVSGQNSVIVQSGVIGEVLEQEMNSRGFTLGHFPASIAISTVGGWVAAGSSGQCSTKYGNIENLLEAVEVVLPNGRIKWLTGADTLAFINSEGTLGVVTVAKLKVFPLSSRQIFLSFVFDSVSDALSACSRMSRLPEKPAVLRLYDPLDRLFLGPGKESSNPSDDMPFSKRLFQNIKFWFLSRPKIIHAFGSAFGGLPMLKPLLIVIFDDAENSEEKERIIRSVAELNNGRYAGEGPARLWWQERYKLNFQKIEKYFQLGIFADTLDVSVPVDKLASVHKAMVRAMSEYAVTLAHFSHFFSDRGCIYFTLIGRGKSREESLRRYERAWAAGLDACRKAGGDVTHHHGIGVAKLPWFEMPDDQRWRKWRQLKKVLDPNDIMNPGRLLKN